MVNNGGNIMYNYGSISYNVSPPNAAPKPTDSNTTVESQDQQVILEDRDNNNNKSDDISNINNNKYTNGQDDTSTIEKHILDGIKISQATQTKLVMSIYICFTTPFKSISHPHNKNICDTNIFEQNNAELGRLQRFIESERRLLYDRADNKRKRTELQYIELLNDIVGKSQAIGVFAREFKKLPMNSKDYNSYTRKMRRWRKDTTTIVEHCQYPGGDKKKTNHDVDGRTILSRKEQDLLHENILKTNEEGKTEVSMNDAREMVWDLAQFNNILKSFKNSASVLALFVKNIDYPFKNII